LRSALSHIALLLLLATTACETNVEPFLDQIAAPVHVVDGVLDAADSTQFIRVQRVRRTGGLPNTVPGEFDVTSVASGGGELVVWTDSIITLNNGATAHLYHARLRPLVGMTYAIRVADSLGVTEVTTTLRDAPELIALPPENDPAITQELVLAELTERPPELRVRYTVTTPEGQTHEVSYPYLPFGSRRPSGWSFEVFLQSDRNRIGLDLGRPPAETSLVLNDIRLVFELESEDWDDAADPDTPGFLGAIGVYELPWELPDTTRVALRFAR